MRKRIRTEIEKIKMKIRVKYEIHGRRKKQKRIYKKYKKSLNVTTVLKINITTGTKDPVVIFLSIFPFFVLTAKESFFELFMDHNGFYGSF